MVKLMEELRGAFPGIMLLLIIIINKSLALLLSLRHYQHLSATKQINQTPAKFVHSGAQTTKHNVARFKILKLKYDFKRVVKNNKSKRMADTGK